MLNGHTARAGRDVSVGDALGIIMRNRRLLVTVLDVPTRPQKAAAGSELYRVESDKRVEDEDG